MGDCVAGQWRWKWEGRGQVLSDGVVKVRELRQMDE